MKKLFYVFIGSLVISCGQNKASENNNNQDTALATAATSADSTKLPSSFGASINADGAITIEEMKKQMGDKKELAVKVIAPVTAVCKKKGCWMELQAADGTTMRVTFKDYGFFVPVDTHDKTAIVNGIAKIEETSVADLKEFAKDDGASKDEIAAIKEPKKELVFEADGVILQ